MSTLTQTEQATPPAPPATKQVIYPKVGGVYVMAADGVEKQILVSQSSAQVESLINLATNLFGTF